MCSFLFFEFTPFYGHNCCGEGVKNGRGIFCDQSRICGKYIKEMGCGEGIKSKMDIFYEREVRYVC